jgi:hypothetical protein
LYLVERPVRVRLGRSLWSSRTPASSSPADIRPDNQVVAVGSMLSTSDHCPKSHARSFLGEKRLVGEPYY